MNITIRLAAISLVLLTTAQAARGATTTEYSALCKHQDATRKARYAGPCDGVLELAAGSSKAAKAPVRYTLTLPDKTELDVVLYDNGLASVNGVPAKRLASPKGTIRLVTGEEEELLFTDAPDGSV